MGAPMDKIEGLKWHLVAKTAGKGDPELDERLSELSPEDRAKAEAAAQQMDRHHRCHGQQMTP